MTCLVRSCLNSKFNTPEKHFFSTPGLKKMQKRWCQSIGEESDYMVNCGLVCEDHFNFEKDLENYMKVRLMNATPVLKKDAVPNRYLGPLIEEAVRLKALRRSKRLTGDLLEDASADAPLRDIHFNVPDATSRTSEGNGQLERSSVSYNCGTCQKVFASQRALATHSSECILLMGFVHLTRTVPADDSNEKREPMKSRISTASYNCGTCQKVFVSQRALSTHASECILHTGFVHLTRTVPSDDTNEKHEPMKKPLFEEVRSITIGEEKQATSLTEGNKRKRSSDLCKRFFQCNKCRIPFATRAAFVNHERCYLPLSEEVDDPEEVLTSESTSNKDSPSKDVLQEKVIDDDSRLVTPLPEGYECADAMFVMEEEGTCMLQQEIPVVAEEPPQCSEESPPTTPSQERLEPSEEDMLPPWSPGCLLPDILEPEEEVEVMEHKVCPKEPRLTTPSRIEKTIQQSELVENKDLLLTPWSIYLLPGALEAEEEKELLEHKLVLEPRMMESAFIYVKGEPSDEGGCKLEEAMEDHLGVLEIEMEDEPATIEKDPLGDTEDPLAVSEVKVKGEPADILKNPLPFSEVVLKDEPVGLLKDHLGVLEIEMEDEPATIEKDPLGNTEDPLAVSGVKVKGEPADILKDPLPFSEVVLKDEPVGLLKDHLGVLEIEMEDEPAATENDPLGDTEDPLAVSEVKVKGEPADILKDFFSISEVRMKDEPADIMKDPLAVSEIEMKNEPVYMEKDPLGDLEDGLAISEVKMKDEPSDILMDPLAVSIATSEVNMMDESSDILKDPLAVSEDPLAFSEVEMKVEPADIKKDPFAVPEEDPLAVSEDPLAFSEVEMKNGASHILKLKGEVKEEMIIIDVSSDEEDPLLPHSSSWPKKQRRVVDAQVACR